MAKLSPNGRANKLLAIELTKAELRVMRLRDALETGQPTPEELELARTVVRDLSFMHQPTDSDYAGATTLAVEEWIKQARARKLDADWLRAACIAHDGRFERVELSRFASALARCPGRPPTQRAAAELVRAAKISRASVTSLASEARTVKARRV